MKKQINTMILLVIAILIGMGNGWGQQVQEQATGQEPEQQGENVSVEDEYIKQLLNIFDESFQEKDEHKKATILARGVELVRGNLLLTWQIGSTFLDGGISFELAGDNKKSKTYFLIGSAIALMYQKAADNPYLWNLVVLFAGWNKEQKEKYLEAERLYGLGEEARKKYQYEEATRWYNQGLALYQEIGYREGEANTLQSLGDVHLRLSEYEKARQSYELGLVIYREIKERLGEANSLQSLGDVHSMLSEYEKARQSYLLGLVIFREIKSRLGEANSLKRLGDIHSMLSEYEKARQSYELGLVIYGEIKERLGEANSLQSLGDVHYQLDEYEKARQSYQLGLVIFREIKHRLGEANTLRSLGDVHSMLSEYEKARQRYTEALTLQKEIGARYGLGWTYYRLGLTFEAQNNFLPAEKEYLNSIYTIEDIWGDMKQEETKSSFLSSVIYPYEKLIGLYYKQDKGTLAFPVAERAKARSFLYLMGNKHFDIKRGVPLNLLRQEQELRQKITLLTSQILDNEKKEANRRSSSSQMNQELLQLKEAHSELWGQIKLSCPEYASLISVNPLSLEEIQALVRQSENTLFLEYYTTPDALYMWVLDGQNIFSYANPITSDSLQQKVKQYSDMIATPDTFGVETLAPLAQELYNLLLKPTETHWVGKTRIGIIPHGVLHNLPFEALMNNGQFLAEQNRCFFYLPSASLYKYCREKNSLTKEQLIALGNPDGSLVFSEKEVTELKQLYPKDTEIFTGPEALESQVAYYAPYVDILHFSCHGEFNRDNPLFSCLKLVADSTADGRLEVQEIFQLSLKPAYLVTLSACETNVNAISRGDELVGLVRAFIYAGTPSVLASLWQVDDYYTEKLMVSFYRGLKKSDKITALQQARKEIIERWDKRHPFYWASFILMGDFR